MEEAQDMSNVVYVDVAHGYKYRWDLSTEADVALSRELGFHFIFICNSGANISDGDIYAVYFKDETQELWFRLKNKFPIIDCKDPELWIFGQNTRYPVNYKRYFERHPAFVKYLETKEQTWLPLLA